jgi:HD-GYP domain-containing protein (c-di-GMP phosphodiesterase class II)
MQQHPVFGALIVKEVPHLTEVLGGIKHHHERYDGKGYPDKLAGEDIPLLGRLLAVPDCFSAMTTERPYRKALSWDEAISEINKGRGTQFDSKMADAFLKVVERLIAEKSAPTPEATTPDEADDNYKPNLRPRSVADAEKVA